jgi:hypothetical protein
VRTACCLTSGPPGNGEAGRVRLICRERARRGSSSRAYQQSTPMFGAENRFPEKLIFPIGSSCFGLSSPSEKVLLFFRKSNLGDR